MGIITALKVQKGNQERVNVYIDGAYAFGLSMIEAARLHKGQSLSEAEIAALRDEDAVLKAVDSAARYLQYRPRSLAEVRQYLTGKQVPPPVVEAAIQRLIGLGHLDDMAFARFWVQNRGEFKPLSPRALRVELRRKGLPEAIITHALAELDDAELAYQAGLARARKLRRPTRQEFRKKIGDMLRRRGFSYSTTRETVERLLEEMEMSDPDYFTLTVETNKE
ncbi:MAG: RecX family transcriptional regulator [Chloroflexi bacterium]|nr:RecX family transcriptional regulator [Chloroflexota bacterium]